MTPLITLTSDFGMRDPYVGAMKGVIHAIAGAVQIVDLSHDVAPQDVMEGALFLVTATPHFPGGSIHVVVIDPEVGTARRALAARAAGQIYVCPDNGLLTMLEREHGIEEAYAITNPRFMLPEVSDTFHGRDVFAPTAAHLAKGARLDEVGEPAQDLVKLEVASVREESNGALCGEIIHIDRFGNAISNIPRSLLANRRVHAIKAGSLTARELHRTYSDVPAGDPLALFGSSNYLEISINQGSAQEIIGLERGHRVVVEMES